MKTEEKVPDEVKIISSWGLLIVFIITKLLFDFALTLNPLNNEEAES